MKNLISAIIRPLLAAGLCIMTAAGFPASGKAADVRIHQLNSLKAWQQDLGGWMEALDASMDPANEKRLIPTPMAGGNSPGAVMINGVTGRTINIHSRMEHGDVLIHVEFMVPVGSNSGVYLQGRYEIQILDSYGKKQVQHGDCGGIYQRWVDNRGFEGFAPRVNASRPPGQWQSFDAIFRAPRFDTDGKKIRNAVFEKVIHNGVVVHEMVECTGPTRSASFEDESSLGPLMLQGDHGPVAYRNIWVLPLPDSN